MTHSPKSDQEPAPVNRRRFWGRWSLTIGAALVLGTAGGALWGWIFVHKHLSPLVSRLLTDLMDRPVKLGEVERVSLSSITIGASVLPPTDTDPDTVTVDGVEVRFNLLNALFTRDLNLTIAAKNIKGYIEQDSDRQWLDLELDLPEKEKEDFFEIKVGVVKLEQGELILQPYSQPKSPKKPVVVGDIEGEIRLEDATLDDLVGQTVQVEAQQINFEVKARPGSGGTLLVKGAALQPKKSPKNTATASPSASPSPTSDSGTADDRTSTPATTAKFEQSPQLPSQLRLNVIVRAQDIRMTDIATLGLSTIPQAVPLTVLAGLISGNVELTLRPDQPITWSGTARLAEGKVGLEALPKPVDQISGLVRFQESALLIEEAKANYSGIEAKAGGRVDLETGYDLVGQIDRLTVEQVVKALEFDLPIEAAGTFAAKVKVTGELDKPKLAGSLIALDAPLVDKVRFAEMGLEFSFLGSKLVFNQIRVIPADGGELTGTGEIRLGKVAELLLNVQGRDLPADTIGRAYGLPESITLGRVAVEAEVAGPVDNLRGLVSWRAPNGTYPARGDIELVGTTVNFRNTVVQVAGGLVRGSGTLANGAWTANLQGTGIQIGQFVSNVQGSADGNFQLSGRTDNFSLQGLRGQGTALVQVAGGTIDSSLTLANGTWNAVLAGSNLQLAQLSSNLQGLASGQFRLSGPLDDLTVQAIRGEGDFALSQGLASFAGLSSQLANANQPLTGAIAWDGTQIRVRQAATAGLTANGVIVPRLEGQGAPTIARLDLNLTARDYDLSQLPALPSTVALAGRGDFTGRLSGNLSNLSLVGTTQLANLNVNGLAFEPLLSGDVRFALGNELVVALAGQRDQIRVNYNLRDRNLNFLVRADETIAEGYTENNTLRANLQNVDLALLNLPPGGVPGYGQIRGTVQQAMISVDLRDYSVISDVQVVSPGLGFFGVDGFVGRIAYTNGTATLSGGEVLRGDSHYLVTGRYTHGPDPEIVGQVSVLEGDIQDILETLQIFELADLGRGLTPPDWAKSRSPEELQTILAAVPAGQANDSLLNQLRRLSEILALSDLQQAEIENQPLPPLSELSGKFQGDIRIAGRLRSGLDIDFDLNGENWTWGDDYRADTVVAQGDLKDGILSLRPLRFASAATETDPIFVNIAGDFALRAMDDVPRTLQLTAQNIPVERLQRLIKTPIPIDGRLNANATLTGSLQDPQLRGLITLAEASLNRKPLQSARAEFIYNQARLNLRSTFAVDPEEPLSVQASIPYRFGFMTVNPDNNEFFLEAKVKDEGLAFLNLFTDQVNWVAGQGDVFVRATGVWPQGRIPTEADIVGTLSLKDATLRAQALPEELTGVTADAYFSGDRIVVDKMTANYSSGAIEATGAFPLLIPISGASVASLPAEEADGEADPSTPPVDLAQVPLSLNLSQVDLNLKSLYSGQVDGTVVVGGSVILGPQLAGELVFSQGKVFLPETGSSGSTEVVTASSVASSRVQLSPSVGFNNLKLTLGRNVSIEQNPLLSVAANGTLTLNGTLDEIVPDGTIRLTSGRVNLFTTSFRLAGDNNTAEFRPSLGLGDPYLKISLRTLVSESNTSGTPLTTSSPFPRNEISDRRIDFLGLTQGSVRTVRIRAEVDGPASQIFRNLELTSSPGRSESEIIALLSGGFLTALESTVGSVSGGGDSFQGLVAVAGSALLNTIQDFVGSALSLSEFSLFPATPTSAQTSGNGLDIGAEIGFDISGDLSVSILKILTNSTPPQFSLRYRLSDQFTIRGTTSYQDFNERTGVLLEYENRF